MRIVKASLWRIARERVYLAAIALSWALALVLAVLVPSGDASAGTLAVISENIPDYMGVFLLVSVPACSYVFGRGLQSRTVGGEICAGNSRSSVFTAHIAEFLVMVLFICLSSSVLACFGLLGSELGRFDGYARRVIALACACVAMASPACLAIVLLRDVLRAVTASALVIFAELWSMALLVHPYISPSGDLVQGLPPQFLVHPAVALKMAVLPGTTMGQMLLIVYSCIGASAVVLLVAKAIWSRAELR